MRLVFAPVANVPRLSCAFDSLCSPTVSVVRLLSNVLLFRKRASWFAAFTSMKRLFVHGATSLCRFAAVASGWMLRVLATVTWFACWLHQAEEDRKNEKATSAAEAKSVRICFWSSSPRIAEVCRLFARRLSIPVFGFLILVVICLFCRLL